MGRWQSENRAIVHQGLRAKEFVLALNQNRIEDIQYRLKDDLSIAAYNSYTPLSFGPDLWQKPLPKERISISFQEPETAHKDLLPKQTATQFIQSPPANPTAPNPEPVNPEPANQAQVTTEATNAVVSSSSETKTNNAP